MYKKLTINDKLFIFAMLIFFVWIIFNQNNFGGSNTRYNAPAAIGSGVSGKGEQ